MPARIVHISPPTTWLALASLLIIALPAGVRAQGETPSVVSGITVHADQPRGADTVVYQAHDALRFRRGSNAEGTVIELDARGDSAKPAQTVHQTLGGPIFDSNVIDLVVASLPLDRGFSAELPFFIYERGGRVAMPVAVRERATVAFPKLGERDAWIVTVGVPGAPATVWVDAKTHVVLRVRYDIAARGVSFTDDRVTPLRG